jgi:hypothetical protein
VFAWNESELAASLIVESGEVDSEDIMNRKVSFVLWIAAAAALLSVTPFAQNAGRGDAQANPRLSYAVYEPSQSAATLQLADWDDHRRCDGDHDRDDRNCYWRDRDGDRNYYRGNGYVGNGYYGPSYRTNYASGGWYGNHGRWHADGWYDKHGKWHKGKPRDDR